MTAWYLGHRVRSAMEEDSPVPLEGIVEMDETWIGGKRQERPGSSPWDSKAMVMGAVERSGEVRLMLQARSDRKTRTAYHDFVDSTVADDANDLYTDSAASWGDLSDHNP